MSFPFDVRAYIILFDDGQGIELCVLHESQVNDDENERLRRSPEAADLSLDHRNDKGDVISS